MINDVLLRESENVSSVRNPIQSLGSKLKGASRFKANALGDVRNTLHSRPTVNNSTGKGGQKGKSQIFPACNDTENAFSQFVQKTREATPKISHFAAKDSTVTTPIVNSPKCDTLDFHNHGLCEEEDMTCFNNFMMDYKLKDQDIDGLTKPMRPVKFRMPVYVACDAIEIPECKIWEDSGDADSDEDGNLPLPDISPPDFPF